MNNRGSSQQYLRTQKTKKEILEDLNNNQQDRIDAKISKTPTLKLGNVKPVGIVLEMKLRELE